jgi:hypothetical protein
MAIEVRVKDVDIENHTATFYRCDNDKEAYITNLNVNTDCTYNDDQSGIILECSKLTEGADSGDDDLGRSSIIFPNKTTHKNPDIAALAQAKTE